MASSYQQFIQSFNFIDAVFGENDSDRDSDYDDSSNQDSSSEDDSNGFSDEGSANHDGDGNLDYEPDTGSRETGQWSQRSDDLQLGTCFEQQVDFSNMLDWPKSHLHHFKLQFNDFMNRYCHAPQPSTVVFLFHLPPLLHWINNAETYLKKPTLCKELNLQTSPELTKDGESLEWTKELAELMNSEGDLAPECSKKGQTYTWVTLLHRIIREPDIIPKILEAMSEGQREYFLRFRDSDLQTLTHWVCALGNTEALEGITKLCSSNTWFDLLQLRCQQGYTPIHTASKHGRTQTVRLIAESVEPVQLLLLLNLQVDGIAPHLEESKERCDAALLLQDYKTKSLISRALQQTDAIGNGPTHRSNQGFLCARYSTPWMMTSIKQFLKNWPRSINNIGNSKRIYSHVFVTMLKITSFYPLAMVL